jgi:MFS transporter, ACS family, D-galactonate transporter
MSTPSTTGHTRVSGALWGVLVLLVLSVSINYIDRSNLSIAAPSIKQELGISASQLGLLLSAFFWTYSAFQIVSGWLVDRFHVGWVLAAGFFLWSGATAATGLVGSFAAFFALRLLLGAGESVAYPCYSKILAAHFAEHQRGLANSLIDAGCKLGPAVGTLAGGLLVARFGWRPFFIVLGLGSLVWLPLWIRWMPRGQTSAERGAQEEAPGMLEILGRRELWAAFAGHFAGNYFWYFILTWLPFYLVHERHYSMAAMATLGSLAYFVIAVTTTITGWAADRAIARGATPTRVRRLCASVGLGFATIIVAVTAVSNQTASLALLMVACIFYGIFASSHWAIAQTLAGPRAAGKWSGLQNSTANLAGIVAPSLTGFVVDATGQFFWAFAAAAAVALMGAGAYIFGLPRVEPVQWRAAAAK